MLHGCTPDVRWLWPNSMRPSLLPARIRAAERRSHAPHLLSSSLSGENYRQMSCREKMSIHMAVWHATAAFRAILLPVERGAYRTAPLRGLDLELPFGVSDPLFEFECTKKYIIKCRENTAVNDEFSLFYCREFYLWGILNVKKDCKNRKDVWRLNDLWKVVSFSIIPGRAYVPVMFCRIW